MKGITTKEEALAFFELPQDVDDEEIQDAYENHCFQVRQKALMNQAVPPVMKKRFETLKMAQEAYAVLTGSREEPVETPSFESSMPFGDACELLGAPPPWTPSIRAYEKKMGEAQLTVANSFNAEDLGEGIVGIIRLQRALHTILYEGFAPVFLDPQHYPLAYGKADHEIKASQNVYSGTLLKDFQLLEKQGIGEKGLHTVTEEIERSLEAEEWEAEASLTRILTEIQRIHKLIRLDKKRGEEKP